MFALLLAAMGALPLAPHPAAPFPKLLTDAPVIRSVAPGVTYADYQMLTQDGPLSVHVLAVDLRDPQVRIGAALANEHLVSSGETVSSMASRTSAVAGINGDYFDINQTNQPLNILVENGELERMPWNGALEGVVPHRYALAFDANKTPQFAEFDISAQAVIGTTAVPLKTINDWPPPGGSTVLITPVYGALHAVQNVTEYALQPVSGTPPFATYRVLQIVDNTAAQPPGYYLAIGPQAYGSVPLPNPGDSIAVEGNATPSLSNIVTAIGGGPLLVKDGAWYADPDGPNKGEFLTHMPATAAGITADGTLLLFEIDGRQPSLSIGVLQPQLAQLMISFGVVTGMQFDGGGSSTIVARLPGDTNAIVQNSPSDGVERRVGDALLVYSDAPQGPAARIDTYPQIVRAFPGARVTLRVAVTDAAGHTVPDCMCPPRFRVQPADAGTMDGQTFVAGPKPEDATIRVDAGSLHLDVPVRVTRDVARADILPAQANVRPNDTIALQARAYDANGYEIALPATLPWRAQNAHIDGAGILKASGQDTGVSVQLGTKIAREVVTVGEHAQTVALRNARFVTAPAGLAGGIRAGMPCADCMTLDYDFTAKERAAYIDTSVQLPQRAVGLAADVYGDGNGEILRLAVNNAINERFLYTLARIDWHGWRHLEFRFPPALPQPITLKALYVINRVGPTQPSTAAGSISISKLQVLLAGRGGDGVDK